MINDKQQMKKKVFVSGCYDLLHSGHVEFFQQASRYGDLYVGIGSDATYLALVVKDSLKFAENYDEAIHLQIQKGITIWCPSSSSAVSSLCGALPMVSWRC